MTSCFARRERTSATRWLLAALAALLIVWCLAPAGLPVYDGIGQPDEPYRFVDPPATAKTIKKPTTAKRVVAVRDGANVGQFANSAEQAPQVSLYVAPGALDVPAGVTSVTVTATPMAPSAPLPTDGTIVSNVYRITAVADGQEVPIIGHGTGAAALSMRAPTAKQPGPVFERRTADGWEQLQTFRSGVDIYQTSGVTELGDFALVEVEHSDGGGGINLALLVGGIALLVVAGGILLIRVRRTSSGGPGTG